MIIWDDILGEHFIRVGGNIKARFNRFLDGDQLPNQNVTVEQAELVSTNYLNNLLNGTNYHMQVKIFSFPKKGGDEGLPFEYNLWIGPIGEDPPDQWWED